MTDLDKATQQFSSRERRTTLIAESVAADCVVTFAITAGIFGVGQLATRLNKLWKAERSVFAHRSVGRLAAYGDLHKIRQRSGWEIIRRGRASWLGGCTIMTLSARFSLLHSDLNDFLFAAVGDEPNGMPLSVISALTRLGVDPWDEAARLGSFAEGPRG